MKKFFLYAVLSAICLCSAMSAASQDSLSQKRLDSIIVSTSRAGVNTPVANTTLGKEVVERVPSTYSLPMMLNMLPSVVSTTEGGLALGYSNMRVRGSDASRTNVTLNGIAINDGESQEVIWANIPSLPGFLQSVQLQRGAGTSSNGPGAFGASLNMQTKTPSFNPYASVDFSAGSYKTFMESIAVGTGSMKSVGNGYFSADLAYNHALTRGYIRNAKANLNSLMVSTSWRNERSSVKFIYMLGSQHTGITWEGCPIDIYYTTRKYNVAGEYYDDEGNVHYYDNETDNYTQHHFQLHYVHQFSPKLSLSSTLHFTKGDGYYENYKYDVKFSKYGLDPQVIKGVTYKKTDVIIQQSMDNSYVAGALNLKYRTGKLDFASGINYSFYDGDHFGNILWSKYNQNLDLSKQWYTNNGKKADASVFAKAEFAIAGNLTGFIDLQYRFINFRLSGMDKDFVSLANKKEYNFFNPKAGLNYKFGKYSRLYGSVSVAHREPSRSDIKESIKAGKQDLLKSERMLDFEFGWQVKTNRIETGINFYSMEYRNQLVSTGRLTETGYVIQENIPDSYRRGVEVSLAYKPVRFITVFGTGTFSRNKLKNYTLFVDAYDNSSDWNPVPQKEVFLKKSNLTLSPELIASGGFTVKPEANTDITITGKYVGEQYMDNSSLEVAKVPSYFTMSLDAAKTFVFRNNSKLRISICVDNLLNRKYYSYGWIYRAVFDDGSDDHIEKGVYAQATIHFIGKIQFTF